MAGGASIVITPQGKKLMGIIQKLGGKAAYVGFPKGSGAYEDGTTVAEVAAFNEFGTSDMPSRPFMRQMGETRREEIKQMMEDALETILKGADEEQVFTRIGIKGKAMMQEQIVNGDYAPNAESTIRQKGSDKPLIDTGQMRQSVNYVVR